MKSLAAKPKSTVLASGAVLLGVAALLLFPKSGPALAGGNAKTAQGIMVNLHADGTFAIVDTKLYEFNVTTASTYFTNTLTSGPTVSCTGTSTGCSSNNQPDTPSAPGPDDSQVTGPNGACEQQKCTFLDGGTLKGFTYTQSKTINNKGSNWTFTWTYTVAPNSAMDGDKDATGVQVGPLTAWDLVNETNPSSTASITITADIAGESVVQSNQFPSPGKFSFSLLDSYNNSRVTDLEVTVRDENDNIVADEHPASTVEYPVDFSYTTNAGSNGTVSLLQDGDARTILNTDVFQGNNDGGADGSALAEAFMDPVQLDLPPGSYSVTLTGTVKGNSASSSDISFTVTQTIHIVTPGCGP